jgi:ribokinase
MIVSLGSINADFVVRVDRSPSGPGSLLAHDLLRTSGGKAANVAVLAQRLGTPSVLLGCVGDDDLAEQALAGPVRAGVDVSGVARREGPTAYSSVLVPPDGAKTIVLANAANDAWDDVGAVERAVAACSESDVVVVDLEIAPRMAAAAVRIARARDLTVVLDPAPADRLDESLLPLVDHLTPDHAEAAALTGTVGDDDERAQQAAEQLHARGAGTAYVKLRDGGCALAGDDGRAVVRAPEVEVVDATGAGDAFAGALAWALHDGRPPIDAACVAVAAASCAVGAYGSQESYPTRDALAAMLERVRVD